MSNEIEQPSSAESDMEITSNPTIRGFGRLQFKDRYDNPCSIQKSSLATENAIWFGIDDPKPQVMARDAHRLGVATTETTGWVPFPIPKDVSIWTRMHLTQGQVQQLLPILQSFAETGELP